MLRAISGESEGTPDQIDSIPTADHLDHNLSPADVFQVLDADASQQEAIVAVKAGANLVIQGPPGTGKSQTITNIIAELLGEGKTVLFVSEKMAALRVVAKRLQQAHLGEFCLEAHSQDVNKERIVRALHDADTPLGLSAFQVHGEIARRSTAPAASFSLSDISGLTPQRLARLESAVQRLASVGHVLLGAAEHPWLGCTVTPFTPQLQAEFSDQFQRMTSHADRLDAAQSSLRGALGLPPADTLRDAQWLSQLLDILDGRVDVPVHWFRAPSLAPLFGTATTYRSRMAEYRGRKALLLERYRSELFSLDLLQLHEAFDPAPASWSFVRGTGTAADRALTLQKLIHLAVQRAVDGLAQLDRVAADLAGRLALQPPTSLSEAARLLTVAGLVRANPRPTRGWFEPGRVSALRDLAQEALNHQETVSTCRTQILEQFGDEFFELATPELLERFEAKFASWTRSLSPSYRRAISRLRRTLRVPGTLSYNEALLFLKRARRVTVSQGWLDEHRAELVASFGVHYDGAETDWHGVLQALECVRQLQDLLGYGLVPDRLVGLLMGEHGGPAAVRPYLEALEKAEGEVSIALGEVDEVMNLDRLVPDAPSPAHVAADVLASRLTTWVHSLQPLWNAAATLRTCMVAGAPSASVMAADVREALSVQALEAELLAASVGLREQFGPLFSGVETRWEIILDRLGWTGRLLDHFGGNPPELFVEALATNTAAARVARDVFADSLRGVDSAIENLRPFFASSAYLPDQRAPTEPPTSDIAAWSQRRWAALPLLEEWCDLAHALVEAETAGLNGFVTCITERRLLSGGWRDAFLRQAFTLWLTWRYENCPALTQFRGRRHQEVIEEFKRIDTWQWWVASQRIADHVMNFGPLNRQGGERRLNVAVTRARHHVTIAASFRPEAIDRDRTKAKGTHLLRSYLEFAERGPQALLGEITSEGGELESPFEEAVATALMAHGLRVVSQVGVGGYRYAFDAATREALSALVYQCVEREGPIHEDRVARTLARVYSIDRVSPRVRDKIRDAIRMAAGTGQITCRGDFLWPIWMTDPPIRAADAEGNVRPIREVALEELMTAIVALLTTAFAIGRDDLTSAVAREMGYERTGNHVAAAIGCAIDALVVSDTVLDVGGQLRLAA